MTPTDDHRAAVAALAAWLEEASAWMEQVVATCAVYPHRRHRAGDCFPVRFRAGELDEFMGGLQDAAGFMRAISGPGNVRVLDSNPSRPSAPTGQIVTIAAARALRRMREF